MNTRLLPFVLAALVAACSLARAQWVTQRVPLHAGWNAVCLQVEPEKGTLEKVVEAVGEENLAGIWRWNRSFEPAEFVVDEGSPLARDPHWKVWYPGEELGALSTLGGFSGGQSYLLQLRDGTPARSVAVKGKARLPRTEWYPNALNLVGFPVGANGAAFDEWFEADSAVDLSRGYDNAVWQIAPDGSERTVSRPSAQKLSAGEAAWVRCNGASSYAGPLEVTAGGGAGLDFGASLEKATLTLKNLSPTRTRKLTLSLAASEEPPEGEEPLAGAVPLHLAEGGEWKVFAKTSLELAPGESWTGTFGVHRTEMPYSKNGSSCQSVLQIRDAEGKIAIDVPVRALRRLGAAANEAIHAVAAQVHPQAGLWLGEAVLTEVSCPSYADGNPLPVRYPARMKLIVHVDAKGNAKLLNEAWVAAATNGNGLAVYESMGLVPQGTTGDVWRASSATLQPMAPLAMGQDGLSTNGLLAEMTLAYDNPVNPFLHRYHPLFDNKNGQFEPYDGPVESRNVTRLVELVPAVPEEGTLTDPDRSVAGTYREWLTGLRAQEIAVGGTFRLEKVVEGAELVEAEREERPFGVVFDREDGFGLPEGTGGTITAKFATSGTRYRYAWSGALEGTGDVLEIPDDLAPGTYQLTCTVTVEGGAGASTSGSISFRVLGYHGITVGACEHGTLPADAATAVEGATVRLVAVPESDAYGDIPLIAVNGENLPFGTLEFTMPDEDVVITAVFILQFHD